MARRQTAYDSGSVRSVFQHPPEDTVPRYLGTSTLQGASKSVMRIAHSSVRDRIGQAWTPAALIAHPSAGCERVRCCRSDGERCATGDSTLRHRLRPHGNQWCVGRGVLLSDPSSQRQPSLGHWRAASNCRCARQGHEDRWRDCRRGTPEAQATQDKVERIVSANRARLIRQHIASDFDALPLYPGFLR